MNKLATRSILGILTLSVAAAAHGTDPYPAKPIRMIVPYPAGGVLDVQVRIVAERMAADLGTPVVVEARPGGNANIAAEAATRSAADGYTLLATTTFIASNPVVESGLRWSPKDLAPVASFAQTHSYLVVPSSSPARTVKDFVELARISKTPLKVADNPGTSLSMSLEGLKKAGGITLDSIYYKGAPPAMLDLANSLLDASILPASVTYPMIAAGKLRALATIGNSRSPQLPNVPTMAEAGYPEATAVTWFGIHAPTGTPPEVIRRLDSSIRAAVDRQEVKQKIATAGGSVAYMSTTDFTTFLAHEKRRWEELANSNRK